MVFFLCANALTLSNPPLLQSTRSSPGIALELVVSGCRAFLHSSSILLPRSPRALRLEFLSSSSKCRRSRAINLTRRISLLRSNSCTSSRGYRAVALVVTRVISIGSLFK